jgi:hypothetical protein
MLIVVVWDCDFIPDDRNDTFFRNVGNHLQEYSPLQPKRPQSVN